MLKWQGRMNRRSAMMFALSLSAVAACQSDTTQPLEPGEVRATLVAPAPVSAVVLHLNGVAAIRIKGGQVFTRRRGDLMRAVLILNEPGDLEFVVVVDSRETSPDAEVLEVTDSQDHTVTPLGDYRVRFGS